MTRFEKGTYIAKDWKLKSQLLTQWEKFCTGGNFGAAHRGISMRANAALFGFPKVRICAARPLGGSLLRSEGTDDAP